MRDEPFDPRVTITVLTPLLRNSSVTTRQSNEGSSTVETGREVRMAASVSLRMRWVMEG